MCFQHILQLGTETWGICYANMHFWNGQSKQVLVQLITALYVAKKQWSYHALTLLLQYSNKQTQSLDRITQSNKSKLKTGSRIDMQIHTSNGRR